MLRREQFRQFGKQIQFELPGNSLGHILAELSAPDSLLNSGREILWHRNADLTGWASLSADRFSSHNTMLPAVANWFHA